MFRGISTVRTMGACMLLFFAAGSLSARLKDDSSRYVVKTDSLIEFHASATFAKVVGRFSCLGSRFENAGRQIHDAALVLEIDADSVATGSGVKDKEIKGKNFFFVKEHPQIRFVSKGVTPDGEPMKFHMDRGADAARNHAAGFCRDHRAPGGRGPPAD